MSKGFSTKDPEIGALLERLAQATGLTKNTIVKQALILFEHDEAAIQLMKLQRIRQTQREQVQTASQEDARWLSR